MLTEDDLEQLCLSWFAEQGRESHHGPGIAPEGSNPKDFQSAMARDDAPGLNPDEIAFYDALAENESAAREIKLRGA